MLFLRVHTWGQGHWGCVGQILNCDLASGELEVTTGLIFWISFFSFCFLPCFYLVILLSRVIYKREYLNVCFLKVKSSLDFKWPISNCIWTMTGIQSKALQSIVFRAVNVLRLTSRACFDMLIWCTKVTINSDYFCHQRLVSFNDLGQPDPPCSLKLYLHQKEIILWKGGMCPYPFFSSPSYALVSALWNSLTVLVNPFQFGKDNVLCCDFCEQNFELIKFWHSFKCYS